MDTSILKKNDSIPPVSPNIIHEELMECEDKEDNKSFVELQPVPFHIFDCKYHFICS